MVRLRPGGPTERQSFIPAGGLVLGEEVVALDGQTIRLTSITPRAGPEPVFNLEVANQHTYYVSSDGLLVHNAIYLRNYLKGGGSAHTYAITAKNGGVCYRILRKNSKGHVDFSKYYHRDIEPQRIKYTGNRDRDFAAANAKANLDKTPDGYTWHHLEGVSKAGYGYMVLVRSDVQAAVGHKGGFEEFLRMFGLK